MIVFSILLILVGCLPEENCVTTDEVDYYRTNDTNKEFYTITEPVYKTVCE